MVGLCVGEMGLSRCIKGRCYMRGALGMKLPLDIVGTLWYNSTRDRREHGRQDNR